MGLIPNNYPKPDLFLFTNKEEDSLIDVTNYDIDDLLNLLGGDFEISIYCLYESSNLDKPIVINVRVSDSEITVSFFSSNDESDVTSDEIVYNNKTYYYYSENSNPK